MNWAVPVLLLAFLMLRGRPSSDRSAPWTEVPRRNTGQGGGAAWVAARRDALGRVGVPEWAHRAILAHWARETGWGRYEWNYNPGNIRAFPGVWRGDVMLLTGRDGTLPYRSYRSIDEGARDYWRLINTPRYRSVLEHLRAGRPVEWYRGLLRAGYSPLTDQAIAEFQRILARLP